MLNLQIIHRKVLWIAGDQPGIDAHGRRGDQAVTLTEGHPPAREIPSPASGAFALGSTERRQMKSAEKADHERLFPRVRATQHLIDIDGAYPRNSIRVAKLPQPSGDGTGPQRIDQDGRVEQQRQPSADAAWIAVALGPHPSRGIGVPLVLAPGKRSQAGFDVIPAALFVERPPKCAADESATPSPSDALVQLLDEIVVQANVQTHGHKITHRISRLARAS